MTTFTAPLHDTDPGRKKLLIVDDDNAVRATVALMLRHCRIRVYDARNGHEALTVAELLRPQLVLLDLKMPGGPDGFQVARMFRSHSDEVLKTVPILLFTAGAVDPKEAHEAGITAVLSKPCPRTLLYQFIELHLGPVCKHEGG